LNGIDSPKQKSLVEEKKLRFGIKRQRIPTYQWEVVCGKRPP
jgi:hypothetical protein